MRPCQVLSSGLHVSQADLRVSRQLLWRAGSGPDFPLTPALLSIRLGVKNYTRGRRKQEAPQRQGLGCELTHGRFWPRGCWGRCTLCLRCPTAPSTSLHPWREKGEGTPLRRAKALGTAHLGFTRTLQVRSCGHPSHLSFPGFLAPASLGTSWAMNGLIQGPPARPCAPTAFPYRCVKLPKIPPLRCCVSSAQKSMLFSPGRGPSSH